MLQPDLTEVVLGLHTQDGIDWTKSKYDVVPGTALRQCSRLWNILTLGTCLGTNIVYNEHFDGNVIWLDLDDPDPARRFKQAAVLEKNKFQCYTILESPDGIHWNTTNPCTGTLDSEICSRSSALID